MRNMTKNSVIIPITSFIVITYLVMGATFYVNDVRYSRTAVYVCPPGFVTHKEMQDCPPQTVSLKEDWSTAITITIGWLPILIMRAIGG